MFKFVHVMSRDMFTHEHENVSVSDSFSRQETPVRRSDSMMPQTSPAPSSGIGNLEKELNALVDGSADASRAMSHGDGNLEEIYNSVSHKKQWLRLDRMSKGPAAQKFPGLAKLFQGSKLDKAKALQAYVAAGEDMPGAEAHFQVSKKHAERQRRGRKLMTLKEMADANFSEQLGEFV